MNQQLQAVAQAAAREPVPAAAAASQQEEIEMAELKPAAALAVESKPTSVAELTAAFPDLVASIRAAAASAECKRIAGIDALEAKGHDELIARMKADGKSSPADVALAINLAEKATRRQQAAAIAEVESMTSNVKPAPSAAGAGNEPPSKAATPEGWKAEFAASKTLQGEFASADDYVAFKANESKVRILGRKSA